MMGSKESQQGRTCWIAIQETLPPGAMDWFGSLEVIPLEEGGTLLIGSFSDQAALRGFLDQLWNLNFTVLSVDCLRR